ncbi:hypothetical protein ACLKA6_013974 [Drosophila palustris]
MILFTLQRLSKKATGKREMNVRATKTTRSSCPTNNCSTSSFESPPQCELWVKKVEEEEKLQSELSQVSAQLKILV